MGDMCESVWVKCGGVCGCGGVGEHVYVGLSGCGGKPV